MCVCVRVFFPLAGWSQLDEDWHGRYASTCPKLVVSDETTIFSYQFISWNIMSYFIPYHIISFRIIISYLISYHTSSHFTFQSKSIKTPLTPRCYNLWCLRRALGETTNLIAGFLLFWLLTDEVAGWLGELHREGMPVVNAGLGWDSRAWKCNNPDGHCYWEGGHIQYIIS